MHESSLPEYRTPSEDFSDLRHEHVMASDSFGGDQPRDTVITPGSELAPGSGEAYVLPAVDEIQSAPGETPEPHSEHSELPSGINNRATTAFTITDRPVHTVGIYALGGGRYGRVPVHDGSARSREEVTGEYAAIQQEILDRYPSQDHDDLRIERARGFISSLGLRNVPLVIRSNDELQTIAAEIEDRLGGKSIYSSDTAHFYNTMIDTAFVFRNPKFEALNGPEFTESCVVHELVHGSSEYNAYTQLLINGEANITTLRTGYGAIVQGTGGLYRNVGAFFAEGVSEHVRAKYLEEELGLPNGFTRVGKDYIFRKQSGNVLVKSRYVYNDDVGPMVLPSSYAGEALDLLVQKDPALSPALIAGQHDPEAYREVIGRLNAIRPGLYATLRNNFEPTDENAFAKGLYYVRSILGYNEPH